MGIEGKDIEFIKNMLTKLSDKQSEMEEVMRDMDKTLNILHQTVVGNEVYGQKGLVKEVNELKDYVNNDKMLKNKLVGGLTIVGIAWTLVLEFWKNIFK